MWNFVSVRSAKFAYREKFGALKLKSMNNIHHSLAFGKSDMYIKWSVALLIRCTIFGASNKKCPPLVMLRVFTGFFL